jgi:hypothetical protein
MRPKLEVKAYETMPLQEIGKPPPRHKAIYFQVRNVGKSEASDCRVVLTAPWAMEGEVPPSLAPTLPTAIETEVHLTKNMRLDWYEAAWGHEEEATSLGKSIDIPPDPNSFFLAGAISVNKVNIGDLDTDMVVTWKQFETEKTEVTQMRTLSQLRKGGIGNPMEVSLTLSWQYDGRKTQAHRYRVHIRSFEEINFDEIV